MTELALELQYELPLLQRPLNLTRITMQNYRALEKDTKSMAMISPHSKFIPIFVEGDGK